MGFIMKANIGKAALCLAVLTLLAGCSIKKADGEKLEDLDFTVVKSEDIPGELQKVIEEKKESEFKVTYEDGEDLYIVVGYGSQETNGYSIEVNELYLTENAVYIDTNLLGPSKDEKVREATVSPYIVVKTQFRDLPVVFQ